MYAQTKCGKYFNFVYLGSLILRIYLSRLFTKLKMFQFLKEYPLELIYNERKKMKMYASYVNITITSEVSSNQKLTQVRIRPLKYIWKALQNTYVQNVTSCVKAVRIRLNIIVLNIPVSQQQFLKKSCLSTWRLMHVNVYFVLYVFIFCMYTFYNR